MLNIKYCGSAFDHSGYASANRAFICALTYAGINITAEVIAQTPEKANYGWSEHFINSLIDRQIAYKVKIIHLTGDLIPAYEEKGKYMIHHCFWETDRLPATWIKPMNKMNEIWTASEQQAKMIKDSGVTVPIYWFPQPIDISKVGKHTKPFIIPNFDGFLFYSIFQWIDRKNPKALLQTYWKTFSGKTDVGLLLKTYRVTYGEGEFNKIKEDIKAWKEELKLDHYPKVFLCKKLLDTDSVFRLHQSANCFVTTTRGEGWQIPAVEAGLMGKPIIGIDKTGIFDYLPKEMYYPCKTTLTQATEVSHIPYYTRDMKWLDINQNELSGNMMSVYTDQLKAKNKGLATQEFIRESFNYTTTGNMMRERLQTIMNFL